MTARPKRRRGRPQWKQAPPPQLVGMRAHLGAFLEALRTRHYSGTTLASHQNHLARFFTWCDERGVTEPADVTQPVIEQYQSALYYHRKPNGRPLSVTFQNSQLRSVKAFFRWLTRQRIAPYNPAAEIELARPSRTLPRDVLTAAEAERVLAEPDVTTPVGVRDRAILETLYSTGLRRLELACLELNDVDQAAGTVWVREGKYRKDRVVPIGQRAREWIQTYVTQVRPRFVFDRDEHHLFLTEDGAPFVKPGDVTKPNYLSFLVRGYLDRAQIRKTGGCHVFRHTMASLMLENGADLRYVQEMLGHSDPSTTQIYTHVSLAKLRQIHQATHPAERAGRDPTPAMTKPDDHDQGDDEQPAHGDRRSR